MSLGGCGGGGSDIPAATDTTSGDVTPAPISGDTSGRGDGWDGWEDVAFSEYINGTWEIEDIDMVLDPDGEDIDLFCNMDGLPQLVLAGNYNN